jgi:HAD superfamily hydrolase (TIGR01549 family)
MTRPRIGAVLLDAGGVLLDLDYAWLREMLHSRGCATDTGALSRAEALARTGIDRTVRSGGRTSEAWRDYFRCVLRDVGASAGDHEDIIDALWEAHGRFGLWTVAIEGAPDVLRRIKDAGYRLGVVSNAEGRVERDLAAAGYDGLLDTVVDSYVVGVEKPDPAIFRIALDRLGAAPEEAVFLGDVPSVDVAGARAAGMTALLLDRHDLYPDAGVPRLRSIAELPDWLERLG